MSHNPTLPPELTLENYLRRAQQWSWATFGSPDERTIREFLVRQNRGRFYEASALSSDMSKCSLEGNYGNESLIKDENGRTHLVPRHAPLGVIDHIERELKELRAKPFDKFEWTDAMILSCDGYLRAGGTPEEAVLFMFSKQRRNFERDWPNWLEADMGKAIEHVRGKAD